MHWNWLIIVGMVLFVGLAVRIGSRLWFIWFQAKHCFGWGRSIATWHSGILATTVFYLRLMSFQCSLYTEHITRQKMMLMQRQQPCREPPL